MRDRVMLFILFAFVLVGFGILVGHLATDAVASASEIMAGQGLP